MATLAGDAAGRRALAGPRLRSRRRGRPLGRRACSTPLLLGLIALASDGGALGGRGAAGQPRSSSSRPRPRACSPAGCCELAAGQRRPGRGRGHGRALALGQDRRPARGDDRLRLRRRLRRSSPWRRRWRGCRAGARRGRGGASRSRLLGAGCGSSGSGDGKLEVVATTTQIGDWVRAVGGDAVAVDQVLQPNTDPHEYEPRPSDVAAAAGAKLVFASGDDLDGWIDQIVADGGSDANVVDLGAARAGAAAGRDERRGGLALRPALVARPAQRRGGGAGDRAPPGRRRSRPSGAGSSATPPPTSAGCASSTPASPAASTRCRPRGASWSPTTTPSATSPSRYGIEVVGAVIPSQTTQAQPSAKDLSALVGDDRARGGGGGLPGELAERQGRRSDRPPDRRLRRATRSTATRSARRAPRGATYLGMEAANADAMVRGFTGGRHGCRPSP